MKSGESGSILLSEYSSIPDEDVFSEIGLEPHFSEMDLTGFGTLQEEMPNYDFSEMDLTGFSTLQEEMPNYGVDSSKMADSSSLAQLAEKAATDQADADIHSPPPDVNIPPSPNIQQRKELISSVRDMKQSNEEGNELQKKATKLQRERSQRRRIRDILKLAVSCMPVVGTIGGYFIGYVPIQWALLLFVVGAFILTKMYQKNSLTISQYV